MQPTDCWPISHGHQNRKLVASRPRRSVMKLQGSVVRGLLIALAVSCMSVAAHAAPISMSILNPIQTGFPGDTITFQGTITNNSGFDLSSTDFFLDFFGYDPVNVTLDQ